MRMFVFKYTAQDKDGQMVRFNVREPTGFQAWRYAWERAEKICAYKGWTNLKAAD
jgi:hypothetical protein